MTWYFCEKWAGETPKFFRKLWDYLSKACAFIEVWLCVFPAKKRKMESRQQRQLENLCDNILYDVQGALCYHRYHRYHMDITV